jgi:ATP-dependent Clp protease ATP-binding subunit ClpC
VQPGLLDHLRHSLISQDVALAEFADRMRTEALTRPDHQPIRCSLVGTAATGKTQCVAQTAQYIGVPYVNVDAASMPDFYTASAQLLGSGRGIVNSHQSGRLEQIAKHHIGAILEISDIDHAPDSVRGPLGDLFLQMLESGEAQSASGAMFSVSNVVFVFTMNLPGGEDESARRSIGFARQLDRRDIRERMVESLKHSFSAAFLSRLGLPIIFDPLGEDDVAVLVERTIQAAANSALDRLGVRPRSLATACGTGSEVMGNFASNLLSFGARAVLEHGRDLAAAAVVAAQSSADLSDKDLVLTANGTGLELQVRQSEEDAIECSP